MAGPSEERHSEERHGIAIECDAQAVAGRYGESPDEIPAEPRERARVPALEDHVPPPAVLDALDRARCGTDDLDARQLARLHQPPYPGRGVFSQRRGRDFIGPADDEVGQASD